MKVDKVLSEDTIEAIHKRLGAGGFQLPEGDDQARCLMQHREDHVLIWNSKGQEMLVAVTGNHKTRDSLGANVQTISLQQSPAHEVTRLTVSRSGLWAAAWGQHGVTVVQMPARGGVGGRYGGGKENLVARSFPLDTDNAPVQAVSWHPGSAGECHLVTLSRSGVLTLHNVTEMEDNMVVLRCHLAQSNSKVAAALAEVAVDICFSSQPGLEGVWPLFVLFGNCDVYCVSAGLLDEDWSVEGPLEMRPALDDNYSDGEACSVLEVGGVLAIATVQGVLYHGIVLGGEVTSIHVYERVELELGVVTSDTVWTSHLTLVSCDTVSHHCSGYLVSHGSGLHNVHLPMVSVIKQAELTNDSSPDLDSGSSIVDHLVCTRPTASSPRAPVLGACLAWPPTTILCLLSTNTISCLAPPSTSSSSPSLLASQNSDSLTASDSRQTIDSQLTALLSKKSTQPLIKTAPSTDLTPALTLELLSSATGTLRREYVARLQVAREELMRRVQELAARRREQEAKLDKLEKVRSQARDKAELLSEKYEDVKDRGQELSQRVETVLSKLQAKIPQLSDKELAMAREVSSLDRKVQSLEGGVKQLKEKEKYQRYQIGVEGRIGTGHIRDQRLDNIKEVLQRDSKSISELVKTLNELKKDLEL